MSGMAAPGDYRMGDACRRLWRAYGSGGLPHRLLATVRPLIARFDRVIRYVPKDARILDIGCGSGLLLALVQSYSSTQSAVGVDVNAAAIAAAEQMAADNAFPFHFRLGAEPSDWPAETFDVVLMVDVLHHIPAALRRPIVTAALSRVRPG